MQVKTSELKDVALDYCIALCEGYKPNMQPNTWGYGRAVLYDTSLDDYEFMPSTDWSQASLIIEREDITVTRFMDSYILPREQQTKSGVVLWGRRKAEFWTAHLGDVRLHQGEIQSQFEGEGPTPLIAAMKCYVQSKLGDTVDIPEELL